MKFKLKGRPEGRLKSVELYAVHTKISKPKVNALLNMYWFFYWDRVLLMNCAPRSIKSQIDVGFQRQWEVFTGKHEKHGIFVFWKHLPIGPSAASALLLFHWLKTENSGTECLNQWVLHASGCYEQHSVWFMYLFSNNLLWSLCYNLRMSMFKYWVIIFWYLIFWY